MGEYFKDKKLGTCEHLMYVTRKEIKERVEISPLERNTSSGNLDFLEDYLNLEHRYIYRFEFEDELDLKWHDDKEYDKTIKFAISPDKIEVAHRDFSQINLDDGKCFNLPFCMYSDKAKGIGIREVNTSHQLKLAIVGERYTIETPNGYTILKCDCCGGMFGLSEDESDNVSKVLRSMGYNYEADRIKPLTKREKVDIRTLAKRIVSDGPEDLGPEVIVDKIKYGTIRSDNFERAEDLIFIALSNMDIEKVNALSRKYLLNCNVE